MPDVLQSHLEHRITLSIREAALATGVSQDSIRRAIWCGDLQALRPGRGKQGKIVIFKDDLVAWLKSLRGLHV